MDDRDGLRQYSLRRSVWRSLVSLGVLALVTVAALAFVACDDDEDDGDGTPEATEPGGTEAADGDEVSGLLQAAIDQGYIEVGIFNEPPYGFEDEEGNITGEAPEVAREILSRLGIPELRAVIVPEFASLIPGLVADQYDMIAAGQFITPDRAEDILFSDPDYCAQQAFAVAAGNPLGLNDYDDIAANADAKLGVLSGAIETDYAEEAGVSGDQITTFDSTANLFEGLLDDRIDAAALTSFTINYQVDQIGDPSIESTEDFVPILNGEEDLGCGGYGFRYENQDFRDAFNDILNEMQDNGEILPIVEPFGFTEAVVERAKDFTFEELAGIE